MMLLACSSTSYRLDITEADITPIERVISIFNEREASLKLDAYERLKPVDAFMSSVFSCNWGGYVVVFKYCGGSRWLSRRFIAKIEKLTLRDSTIKRLVNAMPLFRHIPTQN